MKLSMIQNEIVHDSNFLKLKLETSKNETWNPIVDTEHIHLPVESF